MRYFSHVEGKLKFKRGVSGNKIPGELRANKNDTGHLASIAMETARYQM